MGFRGHRTRGGNETMEKTMTFENGRDLYKWMNQELTERMPSLTTALLGNPTSKTPTQWRYGKKRNLLVHVGEGDRKGWYFDFETKASGDALELVKSQTGLHGRDLTDWIKNFIGYEETYKKPSRKHLWTPLVPVPRDAEEPDIEGNRYLNYMLQDGAKEVARYAYRDEAGNLKGYVFRIEKPDGSKLTPPLAYCQNETGFKVWRWQGFEKRNRTPYGIEKLAQDVKKPILIVEGEKTAEAAQKMFPAYHVLTWQGGVNGVHLTNWDCLVGRKVIIWPDHDDVGIKCAHELATTLNSNTGPRRDSGPDTSVSVVQLPPGTPESWDVGDELPENWDKDTLRDLLLNAQKNVM